MALTVGTSLGHYDVTALIGEGGMGQVWQATDTQLNRQVALKILPDAFATDPDRLARFTREAQILASLNHPNIAAIHGIEESEGTRALVLELVEGPTLADRIAKGPIPLDEALPIAKQIAEALEAAHEAGVIHRDLKPANIKVREDGTVKVLDFGLAKALDPNPEGDPSQSPTLTAAATQMGVIMGTAAYMSPEQACGKPVDKRADVWAFGVVLHEMLSGQRLFTGEDISHTLAYVLTKDVDWGSLSRDTPETLRRLLRRCLERDPRKRMRDIGEARIELEDPRTILTPDPTETVVPRHLSFWQRPMAITAAVLVALVTGGLAVWTWLGARVPTAPLLRFTLTLPESYQFPQGTGNNLAVSPDGQTVVYRAGRDGRSQLFHRPLDQFEATPIPSAADAAAPFISADGESVLFNAGGELRRAALAGGASQALTAIGGGPVGADWSPDGTIVYGLFPGGDLMSVSAAGGESTSLFTPEAGWRVWHPQWLRNGSAVLFTLSEGSPDASELHVLMLDTGVHRILVPNALAGQVLDTGHLVFVRSGGLWAVPFDQDRLETVGTPAPIVDGVRVESGGAVQYALADNGTLVYLSGDASAGLARSLLWVDRDGNEEALAVPSQDYRNLNLSPDENRAALEIAAGGGQTDVWAAELARGTLYPITTEDGTARYPLWSPDGRRVVFMSRRNGRPELFSKSADGTGDAELVASFDEAVFDVRPFGWAPDGGLVVQATFPDTGGDIGVVSLDGTNNWQPLIQTTAFEGGAVVAPNGRWIVYVSAAPGQGQLYIQRLPDLSDRRPVSADYSSSPTWSRDGRELFYLRNNPPDAVMRVTVQDGDTSSGDIVLGVPEVLVDFRYFSTRFGYRAYDVSADGRLLVMSSGDAAAGSEDSLNKINVVVNWTQELLERVPVN